MSARSLRGAFGAAPRVIGPGATLGVLGGGQLGRMFTIAARRLGYRVHTFSPDEDTPTGQVADVEVSASYDDLDAELFETADEAYDASAHLKDVYVEAFHRVRSVPVVSTEDSARAAA